MRSNTRAGNGKSVQPRERGDCECATATSRGILQASRISGAEGCFARSRRLLQYPGDLEMQIPARGWTQVTRNTSGESAHLVELNHPHPQEHVKIRRPRYEDAVARCFPYPARVSLLPAMPQTPVAVQVMDCEKRARRTQTSCAAGTSSVATPEDRCRDSRRSRMLTPTNMSWMAGIRLSR